MTRTRVLSEPTPIGRYPPNCGVSGPISNDRFTSTLAIDCDPRRLESAIDNLTADLDRYRRSAFRADTISGRDGPGARGGS
jgi:hypothetical protein